MEEIIGKIVEDWFLSEPTLFATYCTHTLKENTRMIVPMRCGKMRIEYNPEILKDWDKKKIEERLKYEVIRILLGHPYQRQPYKATKAALGMASDVTLSTLYNKPQTITIPSGLRYEKGLCFEEYYNYLLGDIYQDNTCYVGYEFKDAFSQSLELDFEKLYRRNSFLENETVDDLQLNYDVENQVAFNKYSEGEKNKEVVKEYIRKIEEGKNVKDLQDFKKQFETSELNGMGGWRDIFNISFFFKIKSVNVFLLDTNFAVAIH